MHMYMCQVASETLAPHICSSPETRHLEGLWSYGFRLELALEFPGACAGAGELLAV